MRSEWAMGAVRPSQEELATALVAAAAAARWPAGPLLLDLDETIIRQLLAPHLVTAVQELTAASTDRHGEDQNRTEPYRPTSP